jgi:hypothetical protein
MWVVGCLVSGPSSGLKGPEGTGWARKCVRRGDGMVGELRLVPDTPGWARTSAQEGLRETDVGGDLPAASSRGLVSR